MFSFIVVYASILRYIYVYSVSNNLVLIDVHFRAYETDYNKTDLALNIHVTAAFPQ